MNPVILYRNIFRGAPSNFSTGPLAANGLTYDGWVSPVQGEAILGFTVWGSASAVGIAGHNLAGTTVSVFRDGQYLAGTFLPTNSPALIHFSETSGSEWQIRTDAGTGGFSRINVAYAGIAMELERGIWAGHSPFGLNRDTGYASNVSDSGQLLGRKIIRQGAQGTIRVDNLSSDWVRDEWRPFSVSAERYGFFFQHNRNHFPDEVAYCWSTDDAGASNDRVGGPNNRGLMSAEISVRALV